MTKRPESRSDSVGEGIKLDCQGGLVQGLRTGNSGPESQPETTTDRIPGDSYVPTLEYVNDGGVA